MKRRIVVDANILSRNSPGRPKSFLPLEGRDERSEVFRGGLIRAIVGVRVRNLIEKYCAETAFYAAEANVDEALHYVPLLAGKHGIDEAVWKEALDTLTTMIQIVPQDELVAVKSEALARIVRRDPDDWAAVAAALLLDCPIWTEDGDFFGAGIATWTTETVSIYLSGAH